MNERILSKEEYVENLNSKFNNLIKPAIDVVIDTKQFKNTGCYSKDFVIDGEKEVRVVVIDNEDWIVLDRKSYYQSCRHRGEFYKLVEERTKFKKEINELKDALEKCKRKKFLGIF